MPGSLKTETILISRSGKRLSSLWSSIANRQTEFPKLISAVRQQDSAYLVIADKVVQSGDLTIS